MSNTLEIALIERCKKGDRVALTELLEQYQRPVYNAAYRILGNPDDAADVTQIVFLKAFENISKFNPKYKFFSWIYRIAVNESINLNKRRGKTQSLEDRDVVARGRPDTAAEAGDLSRGIQEGLMRLSESYRTVIVLRHFSGFSYREIGDILQIPEKTVKSRLFSARRMMRDDLLGNGVL